MVEILIIFHDDMSQRIVYRITVNYSSIQNFNCKLKRSWYKTTNNKTPNNKTTNVTKHPKQNIQNKTPKNKTPNNKTPNYKTPYADEFL